MKYMDILLNGSKSQKNELSYYMIDTNKKGSFNKNELRELMEGIITVWAHLTGNHLSKNCKNLIKTL